ncbi:MAG TPA: AAA family ATPase, partial [Leptospiraceae bacterium]|nr:AAA family ATPase [Leptospiraceae bacterium]
VFASLISTYKAGLNNPGKPIGTVLLAGPSGTGKTTSAKVLAEFMFGSSGRLNTLFRLDMSELQSGYQLSRILGSSSEPGILIQHIRNNPFSVILLDEIEKAHPAFFDVIMTLLDEGILSDWSGREVNFRSCIIIMTSNLGSSSAPSIGLEPAETDYMKSIRNHFRPEFLNRIDHIIMFHPLDSESVKTIASIELEKLKTMEKIQDRKIRLKFSESLIDWVSRIGVHPKFGARPLQRTIDQKIVPVLSRYLLQNPEQSDFQLLISLADGKVTIEEHSSA